MLPPGPALVSTVDAWCPRADFVEFARKAARAPADETVLAVTPFVSDEKPLWVRLDADGRITRIGGDSGDAVTAGIYLFSERARRLPAPPTLGRLRRVPRLARSSGRAVRGISIETVVDVDRAEDVRLAEALAEATLRLWENYERAGGAFMLGHLPGARAFARAARPTTPRSSRRPPGGSRAGASAFR